MEDSYVNDKDLTLPLFYLVLLLLGSLGIKPGTSTITRKIVTPMVRDQFSYLVLFFGSLGISPEASTIDMEDSYVNEKSSIFL